MHDTYTAHQSTSDSDSPNEKNVRHNKRIFVIELPDVDLENDPVIFFLTLFYFIVNF